MKSFVVFAFVVFTLAFAESGCANLPRDPRGTLASISTRPIRVGLVEHPPWVIRTDGEPRGAEVDLVRQFANSLGTTPQWHWGGEQQQFEALERYELDLVIGGFTSDTPWKKYIGLTSPYFVETFKVGTRSEPVGNLKGVHVGVEDGSVIASHLGNKGAIAVRVSNLSDFNGPIAAADWQLEQMNLNNTNIELESYKHVMATAPGENGFIKRLDEFLYQKRGDVEVLLKQEVAQNENAR